MGTAHLNPLEITLRISEQFNDIKILFLQNVSNFKGQNSKKPLVVHSAFLT